MCKFIDDRIFCTTVEFYHYFIKDGSQGCFFFFLEEFGYKFSSLLVGTETLLSACNNCLF